jgi:PAS domain S-box-containing protein
MEERDSAQDTRHRHPVHHALQITGVYLAIGTLWILFSDALLNRLIEDPEAAARLQSVKGIIYVVVTALVIYGLLHRAFRSLYEANRELGESRELHRTSADYLRALFETAPLAIFDLDLEGRVRRLWNHSAEELFGWSRQEIVGKRAPFVPEERWDEFLSLFQQVIEGRRIVGKELIRRRRDGSTIAIELAAVPLYDRHRRVTGVMSIVKDITEKQQREQALRNALQEKQVLLKEIHHRVKNNLQVIISLLSMKEELVEEPGDREIFFGILGRVEAMALIHDKLYQSAGLEKIDFNAYLDELSSNLALEYGCRRRGIHLDYRGEKVVLEINRAVPLGLLVNELITNALRHAFPEGRGGTVSLRMEGRGGKLRITVSDNGVGIPREMLQGSEDPERTGINLAYLFAEQVGGILEIKSNAGTEVRLYCSVTEKEEP